VISTKIDTKGLERQIMSMAKDFGESNEAAIARWGVATCRDLVERTQAWGDGTAAKKKQENAILKDANRAVYSVSKRKLVQKVNQKGLTGLVINGELALFTPSRNLTTPQEVNDFIDLNRTTRKGRVPRLNSQSKGITPKTVLKEAMKIRKRRAGIAKGGWIGAGKAIGAKQRKGRRITIGKNFASYAHKFQSGGTASMTRSVWHPVGKITNKVAYVSTEHVLKASDARNAINEGGRKTIVWYETALAAKLKRRNR
jgi:hypothetical protein